ncbi:MAG: Ada metal-binding domain-containing protein [Desulfotomaculales bacterium]
MRKTALFVLVVFILALATACSSQHQAPSSPVQTVQPAAAKPEPSQPSQSKKFVGSINSNVYHYSSCQWAKKISPKNQIWFSSPEEAKKAGYKPCKVCRPPE